MDDDQRPMKNYLCKMTLTQFKSTLKDAEPPHGISKVLEAMWHDGKGDWEASHNIAQDIHSKDGSWVHAYLHRKEGDEWNAEYWYVKAGRQMPTASLEEEWENICEELLEKR